MSMPLIPIQPGYKASVSLSEMEFDQCFAPVGGRYGGETVLTEVTQTVGDRAYKLITTISPRSENEGHASWRKRYLLVDSEGVAAALCVETTTGITCLGELSVINTITTRMNLRRRGLAKLLVESALADEPHLYFAGSFSKTGGKVFGYRGGERGVEDHRPKRDPIEALILTKRALGLPVSKRLEAYCMERCKSNEEQPEPTEPQNTVMPSIY